MTRKRARHDKDYKVSTKDILTDVKILLDENYWAKFTENENLLKVEFSNGQVFAIQVEIE